MERVDHLFLDRRKTWFVCINLCVLELNGVTTEVVVDGIVVKFRRLSLYY